MGGRKVGSRHDGRRKTRAYGVWDHEVAAALLDVILRSYCNEGHNVLSIHEIVNVGTRHGEEWVCQFDNHPVHCCRARRRTSQVWGGRDNGR